MTTISSRFETIARLLPTRGVVSAELFSERLSQLYTLSQKSDYIFGSPLGPFYHAGNPYHLPRFVYFGPQTHDASLRLAFLSGFESDDLRASFVVAELIEELSQDPFLGQGLNLSFFPLIDVLGLARLSEGRKLAEAKWSRSRSPELELLEKDARVRGYHGFVRIETSEATDVVLVQLQNEAAPAPWAPGTELSTAEDFAPWPLTWETLAPGIRRGDGPLSIVDNLPVRPFELRIRLPKAWSTEQLHSAISSILQRFILRQRSVQAYAQHL